MVLSLLLAVLPLLLVVLPSACGGAAGEARCPHAPCDLGRAPGGGADQLQFLVARPGFCRV